MHKSLSRMELFAQLGRIAIDEAMMDSAAAYVSEHEWRRQNPQSRLTTSLHAGKFPGGERNCERQLLYGLMNFAKTERLKQMVSGTAIVGKAIEDWETDLLEYDGRLLSVSSDAEDQISLQDNDHWLSGKPDFIVLPYGWNRPLLREKKTKDSDVVEEMRSLKRSYDPGHAFQTRVYIAILRELSEILWPSAVVCKHTWRIAEPGIDPVIDAMICRDHGINDDSGCLQRIKLEPLHSGVLSYSGRNRPHVRQSWLFEHDEEWWQRGQAVLASVKRNFQNDTLPAHPFDGKEWSKNPCNWCDHKRNTCKPDHEAGVTKLSESHGVDWSKGVFGSYDPDAIRAKVRARWEGKTGYEYKLPKGYELGPDGVRKERNA